MIKFCFPFFLLLAALGGFCSLAYRADLPAVTVLHTFGPGGLGDLTPLHNANSDGARPEAPLVQGADGTLYGTTSTGGAHGTGVVFKIGADGTGYTVLHSFGSLDGLFTNDTNADGGRPSGALVLGKDGTLYGVAAVGGPKGSGTVFSLKPDGSRFMVLHSFDPKGDLYHNDGGASPLGLTIAADGTLFGVAELGGEGRGLIFRMMPNGKNFHVIHSFDDPEQEGNINDGGAIPSAAVTLGPDGTLYGTTSIGGTAGNGVVYKMEVDGKRFTVLHTFRRKDGDYKNNGAFPNSSLMLGPDGFLYGCTRQGGASDGGIVYKISTDGAIFTVLHTFSDPSSENADGTLPAGPLVFGSGGYVCGVAGGGGETGGGTLFKVKAQGTKFFTLHDFSAAAEGSSPTGLTPGRDGSLYGVSTNGGANGNGTIFRVTFPKSK